MPPRLTDADYALLMDRTGLPLEAADLVALREAVEHIEAMKERVRRPRGRAAEPAIIFVPDLG